VQRGGDGHTSDVAKLLFIHFDQAQAGGLNCVGIISTPLACFSFMHVDIISIITTIRVLGTLFLVSKLTIGIRAVVIIDFIMIEG